MVNNFKNQNLKGLVVKEIHELKICLASHSVYTLVYKYLRHLQTISSPFGFSPVFLQSQMGNLLSSSGNNNNLHNYQYYHTTYNYIKYKYIRYILTLCKNLYLFF